MIPRDDKINKKTHKNNAIKLGFLTISPLTYNIKTAYSTFMMSFILLNIMENLRGGTEPC